MMMPTVVALAQVAREGQAVLAGQVEVEQHDVGHRALDRGAHRRAVRGLRDLVAVRDEVLVEHVADVAVVVDDQDAAGVAIVPPGSPAQSKPEV